MLRMLKNILSQAQKIPYIGVLFEVKPKVAVVRMSGIIADSASVRRAGVSHDKFKDVVERAFEVMKLKAVALVINSPGGAPAQCSLISAQIRRLSEEKDVPVFAFVEDVAASGGYWLACIGEEIYAQESSIVGSVGVISAGFGLEDFIKKYDVHRRVYTSGKDKSFLDPFEAEKPKDVTRLKQLQSSIHESFKSWVKARRGDKLQGTDSELLEGAFWTALDAKDKGLIDGIGDAESVMKEKFGDDIKFVELEPEKKWFSSFLPIGGENKAPKEDWILAGLNVVEDRATWSRFGL